MSEFDEPPLEWELPGAPAPRPAPVRREREEVLSVAQVAERVARLVKEGFPRRFWVEGETVELEQAVRRAAARGGRRHWYFRLADAPGADGRPSAVLNAKLWETTVRRLFGPGGRLARVLQPADGLRLRLLVSADFYAPFGEFSLIVEDIDPDATLGDLDRRRRELLQRLLAEGLEQRNRRHPLPAVPLRIGLLTATDSAAYNDVVQTLVASGFSFRILACDVRVQGAETGRSVCAGLATLARHAPDVILLVRGGGSRIDLAGFDREDIARAIAACPVPVLTGIGHEIDSSIADLVAHRAFKTPTAVAEFLVQALHDARADVDQAVGALTDALAGRLSSETRGLLDGARRIGPAAAARLADGHATLLETSAALRQSAGDALAARAEQLVDARSRLARGRHFERLATFEALLGYETRRLGALLAASHERRATDLDALQARLALLDPRAVLARGYAWLRRADGGLLKDVAAAREGEELSVELRDGELDVRVAGRRPRRPGA